ncbi:hypothetical protein PLANPX_1289 [Lacipirellula parvula]|uniref:Uncharacterized protein n=1 Tax=Lacipirellula parvula TaxID=2650471 RepID=A0A5K7X758_9BACT|nr:hypothetical protein PLANPX_1289 [Lacipirellula parvula]
MGPLDVGIIGSLKRRWEEFVGSLGKQFELRSPKIRRIAVVGLAG